jgi:hypothetical protein
MGKIAECMGVDGGWGLDRDGVVGTRGEGAVGWYGGGAAVDAGRGERCVWKRWQCRTQMARAPSAVGEDSCNAPEILRTFVLATSLRCRWLISCIVENRDVRDRDPPICVNPF